NPYNRFTNMSFETALGERVGSQQAAEHAGSPGTVRHSRRGRTARPGDLTVADGHERGHELASEYVRAVMVAHSGHLARPGAGFPDSCSSAVTGLLGDPIRVVSEQE